MKPNNSLLKATLVTSLIIVIVAIATILVGYKATPKEYSVGCYAEVHAASQELGLEQLGNVLSAQYADDAGSFAECGDPTYALVIEGKNIPQAVNHDLKNHGFVYDTDEARWKKGNITVFYGAAVQEGSTQIIVKSK